MKIHERRFLAFDETPLFYRLVVPDGPPVASMLVVHGMGEYGGRYLEFARALAGGGIECVLPDLRGFGKSAGRRGDARRFEDFIRDLEALSRVLQKEVPAKPFFVFGHSFGGLLASFFTAGCPPESQPKGLVLSSPYLALARPLPAWKNVFARLAAAVFPIYSERAPIEPALMTHDRTITARDAQDPLIHYRITARLYAQIVRRQKDAHAAAARLRCPALVLQAGDDRLVSQKETERFYEKIASADKQYGVYTGLYHEILNEYGRKEISSRILAWLMERAKA